VQIVALVCLTTVVVAEIAGITVTAATTDRDLTLAETLTTLGTLLIAALGGLSFTSWHRYRMEG
jgi:hypothetical protein